MLRSYPRYFVIKVATFEQFAHVFPLTRSNPYLFQPLAFPKLKLTDRQQLLKPQPSKQYRSDNLSAAAAEEGLLHR